MEKSAKRWVTLFGVIAGLGLLIPMMLTVIVDPFFQYHKPLSGFPYQLDNQLTQNPGLAKQMEYDSVLLGSSMTVDYLASWFAEDMGLTLQKLPYNAATPKNQDVILDYIEQEKGKNALKEVFLGIDMVTYTKDTEEMAYATTPMYLYDDNLLNDVSYVLNLDVLTEYILSPVLLHKTADSVDEIYGKGYYAGNYSAEKVLAGYSRAEKTEEAAPADSLLEATRANMEQNILPHIEGNPETHFNVFFPPYSILMYDILMNQGLLDARLEEQKLIIEMLLPYDNVTIFYFANNEEIITDLNNYKDYSHQSREVCRELTTKFAENRDVIDESNYEEALEKMRTLALEYDYDTLFAE